MAQFYPIFVALIFNLFDMLSGIIAGIRNHDVKSSKLRDGLFKKVGFIMCYAVAWLVDFEGHLVGFDMHVKVLPIIILYVCTTELVSILENICKINPDILPGKLMTFFNITNTKED